jgi:molybdopterin synthase sulfur carrier subunit
MKVAVRLYSLLRLQFGVPAVEVDVPGPVTMRELIALADARLGGGLTDQLLDEGRIRKGTLLLVDGRNILLTEGLDTPVTGQSVISFFPPAGGG